MSRRWRTPLLGICVAAAVAGTALPSSAARAGDAPGAPGTDPGYAGADKLGFGTSRDAQSPVWFTLGRGGAADLYYPNLSTPASRQLQVVVTDGAGFVQRLSDVPTRTEPVDPKTPSYRQVSTGQGWEATATYVTDPARPSVVVDLQVRSLDGKPLQTYVLHEPTLTKDGSDDRSRTEGATLVASDRSAASALRATPAFTETSSGYLGASDGWTDLSRHKRLTAHHPEAGAGHVGQVGRLPVDGVGTSHAVLTLGYGKHASEAVATAEETERTGFEAAARAYGEGWHRYADSLTPPDALTDEHQKNVYWSSTAMLAASEDKQNPGAFIASPSMPWAFRNDPEMAPESGPYHLVWPRDLYQHATALLSAGDRAAAERALDYLWSVQQPDGHLPQNTETSGEPFWTKVQLDQTAFPIVLAWQLGRTDQATMDGVRKAAEFIVGFEHEGHPAPYTEQERWENHSGYSPGTIASTIAGLVCAADLLERSGDHETAQRYLAVADEWAAKVDGWTATANGPHSPQPYYLRLTKDGNPNQGTTYNPGDNYPEDVDQRTQVDPSFLELVRLGVKRPDDPVVVNSLRVVDEVLGEQTPAGQHWHRFTSDGYGEREDGADWNIGHGRTYGRLWPLFAGERGEYELMAGQPGMAAERLRSMAATANEGLLLPEQVWDNRAPAADGEPAPGTPNRSATPLAWTHAQYVRLVTSMAAGAPVETPSVVADRYTR
ncbi:glucoamylase [Saccharopolyspora erythraea NRRL 2338]|uniref:Glucan 1,4-alpha-glucosidase n=1 Tax=Saccharopolyspora erythraea (strain ATCC 11635 / DSM 40517 / JCM 4748 / NBRC 13426 / NCIMB 8594 / NRRL 2338) TaxID=405948 RepID=A4FN54_SACEN|nr:glycoside hydrolase family 15 protein [Saccharopolyspora erythraea]EQD84439.1 glucan 1,4-alpha-glucosidase [Saccharopolyspora erythraea D]PFG99120.1 glucoamylase [Saccharopolyspora erythraea NRRL 2338]CAM05479.1 glucan 1,4-alpha-glucosidase [Saccharopolyspora erythraea NRRL 2338]